MTSNKHPLCHSASQIGQILLYASRLAVPSWLQWVGCSSHSRTVCAHHVSCSIHVTAFGCTNLAGADEFEVPIEPLVLYGMQNRTIGPLWHAEQRNWCSAAIDSPLSYMACRIGQFVFGSH
jgi:hypothetical protein